MVAIIQYDPLPLALGVATATGGLLVTLAGHFGAKIPRARRSGRIGAADDRIEAIPVALAVAGATFWSTRWPVFAFFAFLVAVNRSLVFGAAEIRDRNIDRTEAVAKWIDSLRDSLASSGGIEQALQWSTKRPHPLLLVETRNLALDLQHRSTVQALANFASAVAHPSTDRTVAMLIMALTRRAGGMTEILAEAAREARADASTDRQVETSRSRMYAQSRLIAIGTTGVITIGALFREDARSAYSSLNGQVVLLVILIAIYGTLLFLMWKGMPRRPLRPLAGVGEPKVIGGPSSSGAVSSKPSGTVKARGSI